MNIRNFYKQREIEKDEEFHQRTGFPRRVQFQAHNEGKDKDTAEIFIIQTKSGKECYGCEYGSSIFYVVPIAGGQALMLIYDRFIYTVLQKIMEWPPTQLSIFYKYAPTLMQAIKDGVNGNYDNFCIFEDEDMACLGMRIPFSAHHLADIKEDEFITTNYFKLLEFRLQCSEEIGSFEGFTKDEERKIRFNSTINSVGSGIKQFSIAVLQKIIIS